METGVTDAAIALICFLEAIDRHLSFLRKFQSQFKLNNNNNSNTKITMQPVAVPVPWHGIVKADHYNLNVSRFHLQKSIDLFEEAKRKLVNCKEVVYSGFDIGLAELEASRCLRFAAEVFDSQLLHIDTLW